MKKILYFFILWVLFSCTSSPTNEESNIDDIESISIDSDEIIDNHWDIETIESTTQDDIDELIDILFETNENY